MSEDQDITKGVPSDIKLRSIKLQKSLKNNFVKVSRSGKSSVAQTPLMLLSHAQFSQKVYNPVNTEIVLKFRSFLLTNSKQYNIYLKSQTLHYRYRLPICSSVLLGTRKFRGLWTNCRRETHSQNNSHHPCKPSKDRQRYNDITNADPRPQGNARSGSK